MPTKLYPGIWKFTFGEPELFTPVRLREHQPVVSTLNSFPYDGECPLSPDAIKTKLTSRGYLISLPLDEDEHIYGLGLQLFSVDHRGLKKVARVNSDPKADIGDTHAPVPFYVSSSGYGVFVDTARYVIFYFGSTRLAEDPNEDRRSGDMKTGSSRIFIEVPSVNGVEIYIFAGPELLNAIQRYNLFSGGGFVPPRWGLGFWYRCDLSFNQDQVISLADELYERNIPCDVIGLEPGWQTHSYSCSFMWSASFPTVENFINKLSKKNIHLNLWTHVFTHESSPIYSALRPFSSDHIVWDGLVPDLTLEDARNIMADYFAKEHVAKGIASYKLDECDNSDFNTIPWSFPEFSQFPSGVDGEQMHSFLGLKFQGMIDSIYQKRDLRTYGEVRSSHALAAPYPYVLYSDLYDHAQFIRGLVNCGFSGLLWCPEVRHASSAEDLVRRLQSVVFSPQALVNGWYIPNPPWKQFDTDKNKAGEFLDDWIVLEASCRAIIELRMKLVPYLYSAFYEYFAKGIPPFRALVCDFPRISDTYDIADQLLVGDRLMVAPVIAEKPDRKVYLPPGGWYDYWTRQYYEGDITLEIEPPLDIIPLYVKSGSVLPIAIPTLNTADPKSLELQVNIYGDGSLPFTLYEDDGNSLGYRRGEFNSLVISWDHNTAKGSMLRTGRFDFPTYEVISWDQPNS